MSLMAGFAADLVDRLMRLHHAHLEAGEMGRLVLAERLVEALDVAARHEMLAAAYDHATYVGILLRGEHGVARIGAAVREVGQSCRTRDTTFTLGEGIQEKGAVIEFAGHRVLALTTGDGAIARLIVADSSFRTERGLGVGSTIAQLREAYGRLCGAVGEGTVAVWLAGLPNVSFGLDTRLSNLPGSGSRLSDDPSVIPDTARVTSLWVISEGAACGNS